MTICKHVRYAGRVQGVGFRYTAQQLAQEWGLAGYVRNLPDGDVELVAQGAADEVDAFLQALAHRMDDYIEQAAVTNAPAADYRGFDIRY
jgi:acylphosphatase